MSPEGARLAAHSFRAVGPYGIDMHQERCIAPATGAYGRRSRSARLITAHGAMLGTAFAEPALDIPTLARFAGIFRSTRYATSFRSQADHRGAGRQRPAVPVGPRPGNHQGRRAALAVGHDGHFRERAQGHGADVHRRDQRQGRPARQEARSGRCGPGVELAAVRREGAPADHAGQGGRDLRLLDQRVAQVGAAGVRGAEQPALLPGAVRRRGAVEERLLHRRGAQPAGHPRGRVPDEQGRRRRQALGAAGHRLRLPAHHQQDPARLPEEQGRGREGHRRDLHPVRPRRLPDHRRRHQEVLGRRQDRGGLDHQRRLQRAFLQGTGQRRPEGQGRAGGRLLGG